MNTVVELRGDAEYGLSPDRVWWLADEKPPGSQDALLLWQRRGPMRVTRQQRPGAGGVGADLEGWAAKASCVAVSPDGTHIACAGVRKSCGGFIGLWRG
eukprot:gene8619-7859_t